MAHTFRFSALVPVALGGHQASQQAREPLLVQYWSTVYDAGPTLNQQWLNVTCFLGCTCLPGRLHRFVSHPPFRRSARGQPDSSGAIS